MTNDTKLKDGPCHNCNASGPHAGRTSWGGLECQDCRRLLKDQEGPVAFAASDFAAKMVRFGIDDASIVRWITNGHWLIRPYAANRNTRDGVLRARARTFSKALASPADFAAWSKKSLVSEMRIADIEHPLRGFEEAARTGVHRLEAREDELRLGDGGLFGDHEPQIAYSPRGHDRDDEPVVWLSLRYARALRLGQAFVADLDGPVADRWPNPEVLVMPCRR